MLQAGGLPRSLSGSGAPGGSGDPFWSDHAVTACNQDLDSFLQGLLSETVDLAAPLVPAHLAVSFGLSTDSTVSTLPRSAAAALGGRTGQGTAPPSRRRSSQPAPTGATPQTAGDGVTTGSKELLIPAVPEAGTTAPTGPQQVAQPGPAPTDAVVRSARSLPPASLLRTRGTSAQREQQSGQPASYSGGLLTQQAAAAAAALAEPSLPQQAPNDEGDTGEGPSQPFGSADREQQAAAPPHLRYDFARAQQDQAAVVAQFQQQQAHQAQQAQQAHQDAAAALFAQQQAAYQQQQSAYQQQAQAAYQQQQQSAAAAAGQASAAGDPASAAAYYQRQQQAAAAAAAAYQQYQNPYSPWGMYGQYGGQYGAGQQYQNFYPPYGQMQFPGMQYPGMQQQSPLGFPPVPAAPAAGPPLQLPSPQLPATGVTEVVNQSEGAGNGGTDDDPCALKKSRLIWTPALHRRFLEAVDRVGGVDKALPKAVMKEMSVSGLTRENVASHLQKYRMRLKKEEDEAVQPGSARGAPRGKHDEEPGSGSGQNAEAEAAEAAAVPQAPPPDADMADADWPGSATPAAAQPGDDTAAEGQRKPRPRRTAGSPALAPAFSDVSDGRTAENGEN